jgi:hypothetical protein
VETFCGRQGLGVPNTPSKRHQRTALGAWSKEIGGAMQKQWKEMNVEEKLEYLHERARESDALTYKVNEFAGRLFARVEQLEKRVK